MSYELLRNEVLAQRPDLNIEDLDKAYAFAEHAHEGQLRYSGEPYIIHPVEAARILLTLNPDMTTLQACLLHDVTEDTDARIEDIEKEFGTEVASLVEGMEKLAVVKVRGQGLQKEKWGKLFLAMAKDIRVLFIKLADRLHNMRTLQFVPKEKQERIAKESLWVHAAIASRLGIYQIKSELEDLAFKVLYPEEWKKLSRSLAAYKSKSDALMASVTEELQTFLKKKNLRVLKVEGRMKHPWSIFQKMQKKGTEDLEDIYDLFAVRVILPSHFADEGEEISHLYSTLGLIHSAYIPMQDRFKDYLAVPKPNGYRSLHSTVLGLGGEQQEQAVEIQLRSERMHEEAEIGVASHSSYKSGKAKKVDLARTQALEEAMTVVQEVLEKNPEIAEDVKQWIENYQQMTIEDRKKGEALLAKLGVSEEHLQSIRKGRSMGTLSMQPTLEKQLAWLRDLASKAEGDPHLELFADRIFVLTPGRDILELAQGATALDFAYAVHSDVGHHCVLAKVNGRVVPLDYELHNGEQVEIMTRSNSEPKAAWISLAKTTQAKNKIRAWFNKKNINLDAKAMTVPTLTTETPVKERKISPTKKGKSGSRILVTGEEDLPVILSACCKPKSPVPVIGYVTRGKSIRIHRQNCRELQGLEGQRFVSAHWED